MSTLSVVELQAQVETDLATVTIQQIIDAVERDIDEYIGPATAFVHEYDGIELVEVLRLPVEGLTFTTIVEYTGPESEPTKTTLAADDYEVSTDKWHFRRLSDGTNPRSTWGWHVVITFVPKADADRRKQTAIALARLEIEHSAYDQESIGDWRVHRKNLRAERSTILRRLDGSLVT